MAYIAIIHIPVHTADPATIAAEIEYRAGARVVGIFDYPAKRDLGCDGQCPGEKGPRAHSIRDRMGFMKCSACGKRHRNTRRWLTQALFDYLGVNQHPDAPAAFRTPEGYGPSAR